MSRDRWQEYALGLPGAWPDEPWDGDRVAKVGSKIFCFLGTDSIGVKCGPREAADEWLQRFPHDAAVMPYIGRHGWNTLRTDGAIPPDDLQDAIRDSYEQVVAKLPKRERPGA